MRSRRQARRSRCENPASRVPSEIVGATCPVGAVAVVMPAAPAASAAAGAAPGIRLRLVAGEEELLEGGRLAGEARDAAAAEGGDEVAEVLGVDRQAHVGAVDEHVVRCPASLDDLGRSAPSRSTACTRVRVRWRSSARLPLSTMRPARTMLTRSQAFSTSLRMWLDSSTVRPSAFRAVSSLWKTSSMSGSSPAVGSSSTSSGTPLASAATRATFCRLPLE